MDVKLIADRRWYVVPIIGRLYLRVQWLFDLVYGFPQVVPDC